MAIVQNFTSGQVTGLPSQIVLTDTSTGTDSAITGRRVYLSDLNGDYYVESGTTTDYELWVDFPTTTTITLDVLTADKALNVRVDWVNSVGVVLYTLTTLTLFYMYARVYRIALIKAQSSRPKLIDSANFYYNTMRLNSSIKEAIISIEDMNDISSAQAALSRAKQLIDNPSYFY